MILPLQLLEEPATLPEQPELPLLEELPADPKIIKKKKKTLSSGNSAVTLASGIDVGQGINVGPGKFGKKNIRRALNTHVLCSK